MTRGVDAAFAGIEAEHDFAKTDTVPAAIRFGYLKWFHRKDNPLKL